MRYLIALIALLPSLAAAAEPVKLREDTYKPELGVVLLETNWGRQWKCGEYENAQMQSLTFTKAPIDGPDPISLELETPSRLFVKNEFVPHALVVQPGEYLLTGFDVKVAHSVKEIAHFRGSRNNLIKGGEPVGGSFKVAAGEIVYLGHFGVNCEAAPFFWRFYLRSRKDFEEYVEEFRKTYAFVKDVPVLFRLLSTRMFGLPVTLDEATGHPVLMSDDRAK